MKINMDSKTKESLAQTNFNSISLNSFDIKYKKAIEQLIQSESKLTFNNSGPSHASIVISTIFKNCINEVRIYANNMNGEISKIGTYLDDLKNYLEEEKKLKIIIDNIPNNYSPAFELVSADKNVQIKIASHEFKREVAFHYNPNTYFTTGDKKMFRLEYDNYGHQALCGFNNKSITIPLIGLFDKYFNNCTPLN